MPHPAVAIPDALALAVCALAAAIDLRSYRVPNWLTFTALPLGLALNAVLGWSAVGGLDFLWAALAGAALGLIVFGILGAFRVVGMGDVKLVAAAGALIRWPLIVPMVLYAVLAGGIVALVVGWRRRRLGQVARNLSRLGEARATEALHRMPYALAIAIGCAWAVASRYLPALRII